MRRRRPSVEHMLLATWKGGKKLVESLLFVVPFTSATAPNDPTPRFSVIKQLMHKVREDD
jgi:hypothetical protein